MKIKKFALIITVLLIGSINYLSKNKNSAVNCLTSSSYKSSISSMGVCYDGNMVSRFCYCAVKLDNYYYYSDSIRLGNAK